MGKESKMQTPKKAAHFRILGIHPYLPDLSKHKEVDTDRMQSIHKALSEDYKWYMLFDGVSVSEDKETIELAKDFKKDFSLYDTDSMKITISAIVGRNGSGKSSFVELFVRAINNLSAVLIGEKFNFAAAEHLHFIDDVYVDVLFQIENVMYILIADGRNVILREYKQSSKYTFSRWQDKIINISKGTEERFSVLKGHSQSKRILRKLFYTLVCNYSLYGFNYRDFSIEATPADRLKKLKIYADDEILSEDAVWLKGIFHKNDGYQTPIVLHPMREDGQLNIRKENELAKERLLSLLFYRDKSGEYPMRVINDSLRVESIRFAPAKNRKFTKNNMLGALNINKTQNVSRFFDKIYKHILDFWDKEFHIKRSESSPFYEDACDYIVYKTLKIVLRYKKYHSIFRFLSLRDFNPDLLPEKLRPLVKDKTHVTKKLRQTLNFLVAPRFNPEDGEADIELFENNEKEETLSVDFHPSMFLPPPIFDTELVLNKELRVERESGFISFEPTGKANVTIAKIGGEIPINFSGLSSGERQIAYTISNILYHMVNVDSEWNDDYKETGKMSVIQYRYMNLILDEVELYFHPEMQRRFLHLLLKSIQSVNFRHLKGVNILFATHSPFILSDIPASNILRLGDEKERAQRNTFGGNIMEMLSDTFFMDSSIGEIARNEIKTIALMNVQASNTGKEKRKKLSLEYKAKKSRFKYVASIIGDSFLKSIVDKMLKDIEFKLR